VDKRKEEKCFMSILRRYQKMSFKIHPKSKEKIISFRGCTFIYHMTNSMIKFEDFTKVDMRVSKIIHVEDFVRARKPSYKVKIDFGPEIGIKWSSVQAKREYTKEELMGREVIGVVNLSPKNIAGFISEVLLLGVPTKDGSLSLFIIRTKPKTCKNRW
jgi:tRNA-binding protein